MAVLAPDLDRVRDLALDIAIAMRILREVAVGALHSLFGVDVHHMDRLAGVEPRRHELALAAVGRRGRQAELALLRIGVMAATLAPFFGVLGIDDVGAVGAIGRHIALGIEQIAAPVALEDAAEVPAMAVIVGELGVLVAVVDVIDVAQEFDVGP